MSNALKRRFIRSDVARGPTLKIVLGAAVGLGIAILPGETQNAVANGDTRTIQFYHAHTKESISATYLVNGTYDQSVLEKLNWFLRDWRRDEPTKMDPKLFDVIWEVYRESGSHQPIEVMSAYRSPQTNAMLRRRSRGVAEHSQHILGKAMDQHYFDVPMSKIREIAMRLQRGGVGFYPTAGTPFVHMDVGGVRHWPRMSYDQLARLFPDGKTVHIPSNGQPLPGYEEARAELESRGDQSYPTASQVKSKGFFAWLFGGGSDEEEDANASSADSRSVGAPSRSQRFATAQRSVPPTSEAPYQMSGKDGGTWSFFNSEQSRSQPPAEAVAARAPETAPAVAYAPQAPAPDNSAQAKLALAMSMDEKGAQQGLAAQPEAAIRSAPGAPVIPLADAGMLVPTPPHRPVELADADSDLPMPPVRPSDLTRPIEAPAPTAAPAARMAKADGISALIEEQTRKGALPPVILQGTSRPRMAGSPVIMAYASNEAGAVAQKPTSVPLPVPRPGDLVSARLDRSNFRTMTSVAKAEKTVGHSVLGSSVVGIRAAARASTAPFASNGPTSTSFGQKASDLTTDRFSGSALKPAETFVTAKRSD